VTDTDRGYRCETGGCIQAGHNPGSTNIWLRTGDGSGRFIIATHDEWLTFLAAVKAGEFDDLAAGDE